MFESIETGAAADAAQIATMQWQLGEIRDYVRSLAEHGSFVAPPLAYQVVSTMIDAVIDNPAGVMRLDAEISHMLRYGGAEFSPDGSAESHFPEGL
ncbi:hypothetical protein [Leifsonia aquatica]|uniref:hypothetical protein n=1 Tax=Leifsonia aquatica TaxID=144185 RepID=UPI00380D2B56